ncbi:MAG: class I poly(R)-hydroxyalkanoic acid synthase [Holosporales bacterium]|jgi:polyhydroxyalkanoate synthase|nr:class I poly(R)-hydroxyalkanoic acid synthase [Holosporales bacterium]
MANQATNTGENNQAYEKINDLWAQLASFMIPQPYALSNDLLNPVLKAQLFIKAISDGNKKALESPEKLKQAYQDIFMKWVDLSDYLIKRLGGQDFTPKVTPLRGDRRFRDQAWEDNPFLDFVKQWYLLSVDWIRNIYADLDLDEKTKHRIDFFIRQVSDAIAPSNFAHINPAVIKEAMKSGGTNFLKGIENYLNDIKRGNGVLNITTTDQDYYKLGANLAITPGKVIFQNKIMQLIQYKATTDSVYFVPLLIIPPWINKYYILDLQPENSFIKWLIDSGYTVFVISWINPDKSCANASFWDYMNRGIKAALDVISSVTNGRDVNVIGYCLGGTLLLTMLAYYACPKCKEKLAQSIKSITLLTTLTDFSKAGDFTLFLDKEHLDTIEKIMKKHGILDGRHMFNTFSALRANDMIWSYFVNNYMMGKNPLPHDILYWNADYTNLPYKLHNFVLRKLYNENLLTKPGGLKYNGVPIDLKNVKIPVCMVSCKLDHIAPWTATYSAMKLLGSAPKFILSESGHIAGIVNPPSKKKYGHWTNDKAPTNPSEWFDAAISHNSSWWLSWLDWLKPYSGGKKASSSKLGNGQFQPIEDAPGRYVNTTAPVV